MTDQPQMMSQEGREVASAEGPLPAVARDGLRPVRSPAEVAEVAALAHAIWRDHYVDIIGTAQVEYMLERFQSVAAIARQIREGAEYFRIVHAGRAVGYAAIVADAHRATAHLSKIYVERAARGRGFGVAALSDIEALCRARGLRSIGLTVNRGNARSIAWYERRGFVRIGTVAQDIGAGFVMDDFRMEKALADA